MARKISLLARSQTIEPNAEEAFVQARYDAGLSRDDLLIQERWAISSKIPKRRTPTLV